MTTMTGGHAIAATPLNGPVLFDLDGTLIDSAPDLAGAGDEMRLARGLPALGVWLWFIITLVRDFLRRRRSADPSLSNAGLAAIGAMLAAGLFEYNFGDSEFLMLFLVLVTLPYAVEQAPVAAAAPLPHAHRAD